MSVVNRRDQVDLHDFVDVLDEPCFDASKFVISLAMLDLPRHKQFQMAWEECPFGLWYLYPLSSAGRYFHRNDLQMKLKGFRPHIQPFMDRFTTWYQDLILPSWLPVDFAHERSQDRPDWQRLTTMSAADLKQTYLLQGANVLPAQQRACNHNLKRDFRDQYHHPLGAALEQSNSPAMVLYWLKLEDINYSSLYNAVRVGINHCTHTSRHLLPDHDKTPEQDIRDNATAHDRMFATWFRDSVSFDAYRELFIDLLTHKGSHI